MNVLIMGATSGIGKALAEELANEGNHIAITGRREERLNEMAEKNPGIYFPYKQNIRETGLIPELLKRVHKEMGPIDLIIVSAGIGKFNKELDWEICESVLKTNILGVTRALTESFRYFMEQGKGHLVNISSVAALVGNDMNPSYNASKAYQANFLESLWMKAKKIKNKNIAVTDIRPGFVDTKLAQGETFWKADTHTAAKQIIRAIDKKRRVAYITKRWGIIAFLLKRMPGKWLVKLF